MKIVLRLLTAGLLVCLIFPQQPQAGGDKGKDLYEMGEKYFASQDYRGALQYYRKALGQNDVRAHYRIGLIYEDVRAHYRIGLIYEDGGRDRDALRHYRSFIDLGRPGSQRNDAIRRVRAIEDRLSRETAQSAELLERGKSLFAEGKYREAQQVLLKAAVEDGSNPEIHFYLGEVYMELEEYSKAESEYNKAKGYY
jgi:tetratricopeptide (TPR) repeat protein